MRHARGMSLLLLVVLICRIDPASAQSERTCLSYEPAVVKLKGTIVRRTYPGPPEYESIRKGDKPETYWLLSLPRAICVNQKEAESDSYPAEKGVVRLQLVFQTEDAYRTYHALLGRRVVATGTLFSAFTIHHKTRVLLSVEQLARAK